MPRRVLLLDLVFCSHCLEIIYVIFESVNSSVNSNGDNGACSGGLETWLKDIPFLAVSLLYTFPEMDFPVPASLPPGMLGPWHLISTVSVHSWPGPGHGHRDSQGEVCVPSGSQARVGSILPFLQLAT